MDSAVSSSAEMSFLKWLWVKRTYQNGSIIIPTARTGTAKKLPKLMAIAAPTEKSASENKHRKGNRLLLPVTLKISCTSVISRLKKPTFLRLVLSLICDFRLLESDNSFENTPSVNSVGVMESKIKKPVIIPTQARSKTIFKLFSPHFLGFQFVPKAYRFPTVA
ncbi:hypothetical protein SDC9_158629 [bioreactor metagenome]|uniref:Uncharacterized protein n=1 Tax=bioreactor metagenome TaxID=1076179 RepID=A0A645FAD6_9ZZZZ